MLVLLMTMALAQEPAAPPSDVPPAAVEPVATTAHKSANDVLSEVYAQVERFADVRVRVVNGVAHLVGSVPSVGARQEADSVAAAQAEVVFVDNQLVVVDSEQWQGAGALDSTIVATLQGIFSQLDGLDAVTVSCTSGVVRLAGTVVEPSDADKAVALANTVAGVVFVDNAIVESTAVKERLAPAWHKAVSRIEGLVSMLPLLAVAGVVLGISYAIGRWMSSWERLFRSVNHRPLLRAMLSRLLRSVVMLVGIVVALEMLGASSLVGAVAGAAGVVGVAFGFAFQDIVENYLAGILLSLQQPFSKDDLIEVDGVVGLVVRLSMRNTLLLTEDGNHTYLPNATVFKGIVTNYTRNTKRRFSFAIGVGTEEDLLAVIETGERTLRQTPGVLSDPPPRVRIELLGDSSVTVRAYGWVEQINYDFRAVNTEAIRRVKEAYDTAGYDMPEPIYRLRMFPEDPVVKKPPVVRGGGGSVSVGVITDLQDQVDATRSYEEGEDLL